MSTNSDLDITINNQLQLPATEEGTIVHSGNSLLGHFLPVKFHPDMPCEGPGCDQVVPTGCVPAWQRHYFHSKSCMNRFHNRKYVIGTCARPGCGRPIMGGRSKQAVRKYCTRECYELHTAELTLGMTGPYREIIEEYLQSFVPVHYAPGQAAQIKLSLWKFFTFVVESEKLLCLEEIRPSCVTHFIASEKARGVKSANYLSHLATFFRWLQAERGLDLNSPIVPRLHHMKPDVNSPRPYEAEHLEFIWKLVESSDDLVMMLAFAIGEQCGLRISETCNIRIPDVNLTSQKIFVRLPTKNKRTRTVPFHDKVAGLLRQWLEVRPDCEHDHLLCNRNGGPLKKGNLHTYYHKLLGTKPEPAASFSYHRLRHTWATRLLNNGMDLAVLKELGGWISLNNLMRYVKVLDSTVQRQYAQAYAAMQEKENSDEDEPMSLVDFARIRDSGDVSCCSSAA